MTSSDAEEARRIGRDLAIAGLLHAAGREENDALVERVLRNCSLEYKREKETQPRSESRRTMSIAGSRSSRSSRRYRIPVRRESRSHALRSGAIAACLSLAVIVVLWLATGDDEGISGQPTAVVSATSAEVVASLVDPEGKVAIQRGGQELFPGNGFGIIFGDRLSIPSLGSAALVFPDGSRINAGAGSNFSISSGPGGGNLLSLASGRLDASVEPQRSDLRIVSRQVTLRVVGTRFSFLAESGVSTIAVDEGRVQLTNEHGSLALNAGQSAVVINGAAPELVKPVPPRSGRAAIGDDFTVETGRWLSSENGFPVRFVDGMVVIDCGTPAAGGYSADGWATGASGVRSKTSVEVPLRVSARVTAHSARSAEKVLAAIVLQPDRSVPDWILYLVRTRDAVELRCQDLQMGGREPVLLKSVRRPAVWPGWETIALQVEEGRCRILVDDVVAIDHPTPEGFDASIPHHILLLGNASPQTKDGIVRFDWVTVE